MKDGEEKKRGILSGITVSAVGDISFEGRRADLPDISMFSNIQKVMRTSDLGIANLENPLTSRGQKVIGKCTLRGDQSCAVVLKQAGINLVSLANNHMMDYGPEGLFDTLYALDSAGIRHVGAGKDKDEACAPLFVPVREKNIAFLARSSVIVSSPSYAGSSTPGVAFLEIEELINSVRNCRNKADMVIVLLHWGLEEYSYPAPAQIDLARKIVHAGSDVIIGHHPHVLQGVQRIGNALVAYSLGNFLFDEFLWKLGADENEMTFTLSESNRKGMVLQMSWDEANLLEYSKVFTRIDSAGCVYQDTTIEREEEHTKLSSHIDRPLYSYWWRLYAICREWDLRMKPTLNLTRIKKNIWKIRLRHIKELVRSLKKSANIAREKSSNPYE